MGFPHYTFIIFLANFSAFIFTSLPVYRSDRYAQDEIRRCDWPEKHDTWSLRMWALQITISWP